MSDFFAWNEVIIKLRKMKEQKELLDQLYDKIDQGEELDEYERGIMETLQWIIENGDKPEID